MSRLGVSPGGRIRFAVSSGEVRNAGCPSGEGRRAGRSPVVGCIAGRLSEGGRGGAGCLPEIGGCGTGRFEPGPAGCGIAGGLPEAGLCEDGTGLPGFSGFASGLGVGVIGLLSSDLLSDIMCSFIVPLYKVYNSLALHHLIYARGMML